MRSSLTSSVFLLVLGCCVGVSEAICVEFFEFDGHLSWCRRFNGPITATDTEGQLGAQPNPPMNWQINSSVFSTIASDTLQDTVITCATSSLSTSHTSELCTCRVCEGGLKIAWESAYIWAACIRTKQHCHHRLRILPPIH